MYRNTFPRFSLSYGLFRSRALLRSSKGHGLLWLAVKHNLPTVCQRLLTAGLPVNAPEGLTAQTPLIAAVIEGAADLVRLLLAARALPDLRDSVGDSPLIHAAYAGHTAICEALLEHSAGLELRGAYGCTALLAAVSNRQERVCPSSVLPPRVEASGVYPIPQSAVLRGFTRAGSSRAEDCGLLGRRCAFGVGGGGGGGGGGGKAYWALTPAATFYYTCRHLPKPRVTPADTCRGRR